ncbi:MAG: hypothetical protein QXU40_00590 [Candidatus Pacearchaeota archaeon]
MGDKRKLYLVIILLIIIGSLNESSAPNYNPGGEEVACAVVSKNNCDNSSILLYLSNYINAHSSTKDQPGYNYVLCCNNMKGIRLLGGDQCNNNLSRVLLRLSSDTNSHAEGKEFSNASYRNFCYSGFINVITTRGPDPRGNYVRMFSLSDFSNGHIGHFNAYPIKVYGIPTVESGEGGGDGGGGGVQPPSRPPVEGGGEGVVGPGGCVLREAYWKLRGTAINETTKFVRRGSNITLFVRGDNCENRDISFNIFSIMQSRRILGVPSTMSNNNIAEVGWITNLSQSSRQSEEYYFNVTLDNLQLRSNPPNLVVYNSNNIRVCGDYLSEQICNVDPERVARNSVPDPNLCNRAGWICRCNWFIGESPRCRGVAETLSGGLCTFNSTIVTTCEDGEGFMTIQINATWIGNQSNRPNECVSGVRTIECPAYIPLPLFGTAHLIISILLLAIIYSIFLIRQKIINKKN